MQENLGHFYPHWQYPNRDYNFLLLKQKPPAITVLISFVYLTFRPYIIILLCKKYFSLFFFVFIEIESMKKKILDFKKGSEPIVCLTAYTAPMAAMADKHCDLLLVGDSVSMVLYGKDSTQGASMPMMIAHGQAVVKQAKQALVVVDMPYGSYEESDGWALRFANVIMRKTGCDAVKRWRPAFKCWWRKAFPSWRILA